jgi:hypothetical protein
MAMWQLVVKIALTWLLSSLVVIVVAALLKLRFTGKSLYQILLNRKKITYLFFVLLILLIPVAFSLPRGKLLSPEVLAAYLMELVVSVIVVVSFGATWIALDDPASILRQVKVRYAMGERAMITLWLSATGGTMELAPIAANPGQTRLGDALLALDRGEIALNDVEEMEQSLSLVKWIHEKDTTGWHELREQVLYGDGLRPRARLIVKRELWRVREERYRTGDRPGRGEGLEKQLGSLLSP